MKIKHRALSLILVLALCLGLLPAAYAAGTDCSYSVIAGGASHSLAVQDNGTVLAWGSNSDKQVDPSSNEESIEKPAEVKGLSSAVAVAAGSDFSVALLYDGTVTAWGGGENFFAVPGLSDISSVSAGQSTLLALKYDGSVWQWNFGDAASQPVAGLENISAVAAGGGHYLALSRSGQVWAWGSNSRGQLGTGSKESQVNTPQMVEGLMDIVSIAAGYSHSLAVDFNGQIYSWGSNGRGQLGNGKTVDSNTPQTVSAVKKAVQVSAGYETSMAFTEDGKLYTWGYGEYGQLGNNNSENSRSNPGAITGNNFGTPVLIASGMNHNLLLNNRGTVYTWGRNGDFQLGTGKNSNATTPQRIYPSLTENSPYTMGRYDTDVQSGMSNWAINDLTALYKTQMVPPSLWERYSQNITRAEFAHLIVAVYEHVGKPPANDSSQFRFEDVKGHPLEKSILKAYQYKLLQGRSDTQFAPDEYTTRQEAAVLLGTLVSNLEKTTIPTAVSSLPYYSDASKVSTWANPHVAFAHDKSIMLGTDGKFNPTGYTTKEQALVIIARLVERYGWAQ